MPYEVFNRKAPRILTPAITIHPSGRMYFNQGTSSRLLGDKAKWVLLLWDKEQRKLAIQPLAKTDNRAYSIAYSHKGSGSSVTAKGFLEWIGYNISDTQTLTLDVKWNEREGVFEANIPQEKILGEHAAPINKPKKTRKTGSE